MAGLGALAAGSVLLGRELHLPGFRPTPTPPGRLVYWHLTGVEFGLLVSFILLLGFTCQAIGVTLLGGMIKASPESRGLQVAVLGLAFHGGSLLAWPLFTYYRRSLFANYSATPPEEPAPGPARLGWGEVLSRGAGTFLAALPLVLLVSWTWRQGLDLMGLPAESQELIAVFRSTRDPLVLAGMHLVACVIGPINEELLLRRGLFHFLRQRTARYSALILSSLCFGALHSNLASFLPLSVLGFVLATAYERSGDVRVPIVAHALFNLNTLLFLQAGLSD